jgi:enoyl-CoA hydratase
MLLVGDPITAERALTIGLVNYVVAKGTALQRATDLAAKIAANGPVAVAKIKEGMLRGSGLPLVQSLEAEYALVAEVLRTEDVREGAHALRQRRPPAYRGR